jgi:LEA14-like dessication related protein
MHSRTWMIVLGIIIVVGIAVWAWWRSPGSETVKKEAGQKISPQLTIATLNITAIDKDKIQANSKVTLKNPLPVDITARKMNYAVFIDSVKVLEDAYKKPISIKSSGSTNISLPMIIQTKALASVLKHFEAHNIDSANYAIKANFEVDIPVAGERNFTMQFDKKLPALYIPKIKIKEIDVNGLQLKKRGMDMVVQVINPNKFPIAMKNAAFDVAIDDDMKMEGSLEKIVSIPAGGKENITMNAVLKEGKLLKTGWKILTDKNDTRLSYNFKCKLITGNSMLDNSTLAAHLEGTLQELLSATKEVSEVKAKSK